MNIIPGTSRAILNPKLAETGFELTCYAPSEDLAYFIERYWIIRWDRQGREPFIQETLPFPCVNLVFEAGRSGVFGVGTGRFTRSLIGEGKVFGVKFRPGAFYPFLKQPVCVLSDNCMSLEAVFGIEGDLLTHQILAHDEDDDMVEAVECFLRGYLPESDPEIAEINAVIDYIIDTPSLTKVDQLVTIFGFSKRTLQRLFNQYVGVSPKWVINRYRLHDAVNRLDQGQAIDFSRLAQDLGYFDQAHFIKDFKRMVSKTPAEYVRCLGEPITS